MDVINIHAAKTNLSKLLQQVEKGGEVVIGRNGKPLARLVPYKATPRKELEFGKFKDKIWIADDFNDFDAEIEKMFDEGPLFPDEQT